MQIDPQFCHVFLIHVVCVTSVPVRAVPEFADVIAAAHPRIYTAARQAREPVSDDGLQPAAEPPPAPCSGPAHLIGGTQAAPVYVMPSLAKSSSSGCGIPVSNGQGPSKGASVAGSGGDCKCCMPCTVLSLCACHSTAVSSVNRLVFSPALKRSGLLYLRNACMNVPHQQRRRRMPAHAPQVCCICQTLSKRWQQCSGASQMPPPLPLSFSPRIRG